MTANERDFQPLGGETVYEGQIITVARERFRYPDGDEVQRDVVHHPGAVAIVAIDGDAVILVRQPREAVGERDLLELPAGRLDGDGETPLQTAQRELEEEVGKAADHWEPVKRFYTSVGVLDEEIHLFLATGLHDEHRDSGENERIEIVRWPLADLDRAIEDNRDAKTLIGLLWLRARGLAGTGGAPPAHE
jgi:8-oxo-dGTP pyrophosphatase MutT (NUDIX family)